MHVKVYHSLRLATATVFSYLEDYNCVCASIMDWIQHFQIPSQITENSVVSRHSEASLITGVVHAALLVLRDESFLSLLGLWKRH